MVILPFALLCISVACECASLLLDPTDGFNTVIRICFLHTAFTHQLVSLASLFPQRCMASCPETKLAQTRKVHRCTTMFKLSKTLTQLSFSLELSQQYAGFNFLSVAFMMYCNKMKPIIPEESRATCKIQKLN